MVKAAKPLIKVGRNGVKFFVKNSNVILTFIGATGVVVTAAAAIKGTIKAVKIVEEKQVVGAKEVVKTVWKCYIPTIGFLFLTVTAILCNGKINARKIAVLTSAYSGATEALKKVEEKMTEEIGPKKTDKVMTSAEKEVAQAQMPKDQNAIIATGKGKQLFFCMTTGQWFYSDWNGVELAEMKLKKVFTDITRNWGQGEFVPVREAQEALGLPVTDMGEYMGWDTDDFLDTPNPEFVKFTIASEWMDLPWGRETVGIVRFTPWPINL
jgi:hypothetical protein